MSTPGDEINPLEISIQSAAWHEAQVRYGRPEDYFGHDGYWPHSEMVAGKHNAFRDGVEFALTMMRRRAI